MLSGFHWRSLPETRCPAPSGKGNSGVAIAVILLMLAIAMAVTAGAGLLTHQNYTNVQNRESLLKAKYAFRAGLSTASVKLVEDPSWNPTETAPYEEYLDDGKTVGFRVWLDGINRDSDAPIMSGSGQALQRGQASLRVEALVFGQVVSGGFGGLQAEYDMIQPPIEFEHAVMRVNPGGTLNLPTTKGCVLSYDSEAGVTPADPDGPIPLANQGVSLRAMSNVDLKATGIYGDLILPPTLALAMGSGFVGGLVERRDEGYIPRKIVPPEGWDQGLLNAGAFAPGVPKLLAPGMYNELFPAAGAILELQYGGVYGFCGALEMKDNSELRLVGDPANGPCTIYVHSFKSGTNSVINMPVPGESPRPADLQIYGMPYYDCNSMDLHFQDGSRSALVASIDTGEAIFGNNVEFFGSIVAEDAYFGENVSLHYDVALRGDLEVVAETEWVLVSEGLR